MTMGGDNFIRSYKERMAKKQDNEQAILRFLKDEIYSTAEILSRVLNYTATSTVYTALNRMCAKGLLSTEKVDLGGYRPFNVYGITQHGAVMVLDDHDDPFKLKAFEPSKITLSTLEHRFDVQRLSLAARHQGYQWKPTSNLKLEKGQKYPDGLMRKEGNIWAVEVERVSKSPKRYRDIVEIYLNQITVNHWAGVVYLFPDSQLRDRVKRIFYAVDAASIGGRLQPLSPDMTDRFFDFKTYEEFARE
ncbi:replication-relaxation family protein [Xenorhabdus innexi]|uniref:MobC protein n=1 Tax=Xenorhabdus innexi TaxID=290109 RepID=A0A1N6MWY3_9GAMM|nr:replication-relaxation family protein [Xenorhabdus innexi]PHM28139.1 MobC protein [Xenorhabdus innexi]SIP73346.1 putative MobC protein [Xenorhabdus innexi]